LIWGEGQRYIAIRPIESGERVGLLRSLLGVVVHRGFREQVFGQGAFLMAGI